jgi:hypothetical protein
MMPPTTDMQDIDPFYECPRCLRVLPWTDGIAKTPKPSTGVNSAALKVRWTTAESSPADQAVSRDDFQGRYPRARP